MAIRKDKRHVKNMLVYLKGDSLEFLGMTANLSKNGLFVESRKKFSLHCELDILLASDNQEIFNLKAEVMWIKIDNHPPCDQIPDGMGLKILEAPSDYWNYIEYIKYGKAIDLCEQTDN